MNLKEIKNELIFIFIHELRHKMQDEILTEVYGDCIKNGYIVLTSNAVLESEASNFAECVINKNLKEIKKANKLITSKGFIKLVIATFNSDTLENVLDNILSNEQITKTEILYELQKLQKRYF